MSTYRKDTGSQESSAKSLSFYFFMAMIALSAILAIVYVLML